MPAGTTDGVDGSSDVWCAIAALPVERRSVLVLAMEPGVTYRQIAEQLGITEEITLNHIREGLLRIHDQLAAEVSRSGMQGSPPLRRVCLWRAIASRLRRWSQTGRLRHTA